MNWKHVKTIVWLRWKLTWNQWERSGTFHKIIMLCLMYAALASAFSSFFIVLGAGIFLLPKATPDQILIAWDVLCGGFTVFWCIGVFAELQRVDMISLDRLLRWPLTVSNAFTLNYVASLASLYVACFLPAAIGFNLALVITRGAGYLLLLPIIFAFIFAITASTYLLQSWLAVLMSNPRRRQTVIVLLLSLIHI